jgi:hypothetical protein
VVQIRNGQSDRTNCITDLLSFVIRLNHTFRMHLHKSNEYGDLWFPGKFWLGEAFVDATSLYFTCVDVGEVSSGK